MGFIFDGLLGGTITLAVLYIFLSTYVYQRLLWVQANSPPGLNVRKLFVMTLLLTAIVRSMSFISMTLLSLGSVDFKLENGTINDDESQSADKDFFNKAAVALFDFPDFYFVSAYVLLVIVWAEAYLKSRRHWLSASRFHSFWIWSYFLFNVLLYTCQIALYSLLFLPTIDHYVETSLIYICLSAFNICLPVCWLVLFLYLTLVVSRALPPLRSPFSSHPSLPLSIVAIPLIGLCNFLRARTKSSFRAFRTHLLLPWSACACSPASSSFGRPLGLGGEWLLSVACSRTGSRRCTSQRRSTPLCWSAFLSSLRSSP